MRNLLFTFSLLPALFTAQTYRDQVAEKTCACIEKRTAVTKRPPSNEELGICLLIAVKPYHKEVKQDLGIDIVRDIENEEKMTRLGVEMGFSLAEKCPAVMAKVFAEAGGEASSASNIQYFSGTVQKIETESYTVLYLQGDNGTLTKFYLISEVESNVDIPSEYRELQGKSLNVSYYQSQIFDHRINDYRLVNVLTSLKTAD